MRVPRALTILTAIAFISATAAAGTIGLKISGPGVVDDSTVTVGEPFSVDIHVANDSIYTGFSFGFDITSEEITEIIHVADSGNGLNKQGDIKGHNGWQSHSIWNFGGVYAVESDWDGELPDLLGFGGLSINQDYEPHDLTRVLSFELIIPEPGSIVVDSAFFPPGGRWMFATPVPGTIDEPTWQGPLTIRAVAK